MINRARAIAHWGLWSAYPARTRPVGRLGRSLPAVITLALLFVVWLAITRGGVVDGVLLPDPLAVASRLGSWTASGVLWQYLASTLGVALLGSLIAMVVAVPAGILMAHSRLLSAILEPFVTFSQTMPLVAIAPLLVLWLGYGTIPIAVLCAIVAFFPMLTTTVVGLRALDMRIVEHALLDGAGFWRRLLEVELPVGAPAILAGIRAGFILSMTGAIVGEFVMGGHGLGTLLTQSRQSADTVGVFAVLVVIGAVALVLQGLIHALERASARRLQGETA